VTPADDEVAAPAGRQRRACRSSSTPRSATSTVPGRDVVTPNQPRRPSRPRACASAARQDLRARGREDPAPARLRRRARHAGRARA
jgi:hypothetical protein